MQKASQSDAFFAIAGYYDPGEVLELDKSYAAQLYKKAADGGYSTAKLFLGLNLFYGGNGIRQDKALERRLLQEVAQRGDGALT